MCGTGGARLLRVIGRDSQVFQNSGTFILEDEDVDAVLLVVDGLKRFIKKGEFFRLGTSMAVQNLT